MNKILLRCLISALGIAALAVALKAQRGYSAPGRTWWDGGIDTIFAREDDYENATGFLSVLNVTPVVRTRGHAFFEPLGPNGRACITCRNPGNSRHERLPRRPFTNAGPMDWQGKDPIFAAIDGSNCPDLPQNLARSHSLLLDRGLFRIPIAWPPRNAKGEPIEPDFRIEVVRDPTGCNLSATYGLHGEHAAVFPCSVVRASPPA